MSGPKSLPTQTRQWTLVVQPEGKPTYKGENANFQLETVDLPNPLLDRHILVKTLYLSNDPAQRGWISPPSQISPRRLYVAPVPVGSAMRSRGIGRVLASNADGYAPGDLVQCVVGWREYAAVDVDDPNAGVRKLTDVPGVSVTHYLGALGSTGLTAWYGLCVIAACQRGDRVVVSGAAGATGSMVVQIAKHIVGASYVVGIAGSPGKCRWVESLGADVCLDYKSESFETELTAACSSSGEDEDGVDVYFDNVGGHILDLMLANMKREGRIAACGAITGYNGEKAVPMKNWFQVVTMRLQIKGFIVNDWLKDNAVPTVRKLVDAVKEGKIRLGDENETVVDTDFEHVPRTWLMLFEGGNQGKLITKIV